MKSSSGKYFIGLDHVRAVAAFLVFAWHFILFSSGYSAPPPVFPLSLVTEGHTGVALFMALSGYLFAKLLDGKNIKYASFIWNRFLRLTPLLMVVIVLVGIQQYFSFPALLATRSEVLAAYIKSVICGVIMPSLPNGAWSITVEFHFYLMLPVLLFLTSRWKYSLIFVLFAAVVLRCLLYQHLGQIQTLSFWTIIGRIDQFLLGILAYQFRRNISGRKFFVLGVLFLFTVFYWYFDSQGGYVLSTSSSMWIYIPTLEGVAYALAIAWYDNSFEHSTGRVSRFIALIGTYSYSIYLLHLFIVPTLSSTISKHIIDLSNVYIAMLFSGFCFFLMIPIGYVSYKFIELPFLKFRTRYIINGK